MKRIIIIALAALIGFTVSAAELTVADASASAQIFKKSKAERTILANEKKVNFMKTFNSKGLLAL